jgi:hypothetical protein
MQFRFFGAPIQLRVFYALISSLLWLALTEIADHLHGSTSRYLADSAGAVFAALVLVPYLPGLKGTFKLRALALLYCGFLSYAGAIKIFFWLADSEIFGRFSFERNVLVSMAAAGAGGALIVGIGARLLVPLVLRWSGWLMLMAAGLLGGIVLSSNFHLREGDSVGLLPGHIAWQVLVCLALYYGSRRITPPRARP